ncbi:MAG: hypothetical protein ACKVJV_05520 [Gammaproteobacteria bacterium]
MSAILELGVPILVHRHLVRDTRGNLSLGTDWQVESSSMPDGLKASRVTSVRLEDSLFPSL